MRPNVNSKNGMSRVVDKLVQTRLEKGYILLLCLT